MVTITFLYVITTVQMAKQLINKSTQWIDKPATEYGNHILCKQWNTSRSDLIHEHFIIWKLLTQTTLKVKGHDATKS